MKSGTRKAALLAAALCATIATVLYGHHLNFYPHHSPEDSDIRWLYDDHDLWNITTVTSDELPSSQAEGACSLRATARRDSFLGPRFNFSGPVLQWAGSFRKTAWESLRNHLPPYGWQGLPLGVVRSALAPLSAPASGRLFERRSADQCVRCAVVGNGGILRGSGQGAAIDRHHYVFRVNGAVTAGFEEDVGTRTSFYGFTTNTMKHSLIAYRRAGFSQVPRGDGTRYIFIPSNLRDYVMLAGAERGRTVPLGEDRGDRPSRYFGSVSSPEQFKMLHPDFIRYVTQRFLSSPLLRYRETRHLYMPSTGALMLLAALHTCDEVSAYGFITMNYADFSDHYYDRVKKPLRFYANHDMQMEAWLWDVLDSRKVMKLYRRSAGKL